MPPVLYPKFAEKCAHFLHETCALKQTQLKQTQFQTKPSNSKQTHIQPAVQSFNPNKHNLQFNPSNLIQRYTTCKAKAIRTIYAKVLDQVQKVRQNKCGYAMREMADRYLLLGGELLVGGLRGREWSIRLRRSRRLRN